MRRRLLANNLCNLQDGASSDRTESLHSESDPQTSPAQSQKSPTCFYYANMWKKSTTEPYQTTEAIPTFSCPPQPTSSSSSFTLEQNVPRTVPCAPPLPPPLPQSQPYFTGAGMVSSSAHTAPFLNGEKEYDLIQVLFNISSFHLKVISPVFSFLSFHNPHTFILQELLKLNIQGCIGSGCGIGTFSQNLPNTAALHTRLHDVKPDKGSHPVKVPTKFRSVCDTGTKQRTVPLEQQSNQLHPHHQQQSDLLNCWSSTAPLHQVSAGKHSTPLIPLLFGVLCCT